MLPKPMTGAILALALASIGCLGRSNRPRPNIVLIVIDTIRADHLGCYGYHRPTSPHIDNLSTTGVLFEQAAAVASYTRPSTASLLTGMYPSVHGAITHADSISPLVPTLAEILRDAGYSTAGFYRNGNVSDSFGFGRGFDTYVAPDKEYWRSLKSKRAGQSDDALRFVSETDDAHLTRQAVPFVREIDTTPFFLYLHLGGAHDPYTPPRDAVSFLDAPLTATAELFYRQPVKSDRTNSPVLQRLRQGSLLLDELTRKQMVALYDAEIAFADEQVGAVLEALGKTTFGENTVVIVTADHGEEFWDHGDLGHGQSHFQELLHVPLVIAGPGIRSRRIDDPVSLIDLMPTVLELTGLEQREGLPGRSLAPVLESRRKALSKASLYAEGLLRLKGNGDPMLYRSLQQSHLKLILDFQRQRKMLFDLEADSEEQKNFIAAMPEEGRELLDRLIAIHLANLESPYLAPVEAVDIPEDLEARLRALGYLGEKSDSAAASLFRTPLRRLDIDSYGFLGHERDGGRYRPMLDFSVPEFPEEQLLYGWGKKDESRPVRGILRKSGVRLRRDVEHKRWRMSGQVRRSANAPETLAIHIRIDGNEPEIHTLQTGRPFEIGGFLPTGGRPYVRFDLECDAGFIARRGGRTDEQAPCMVVDFLGLVEE